jgi:hypothetical protein
MYHLVNRLTGAIVGVCAGKNYLQHQNDEIIVIEGDADRNTHCYDSNNLTSSGIKQIQFEKIQQESNDKEVKKHLRNKRLQKLKQSDWTQLPDSPLSDSKKAEWSAYRQALRDIPQTYSDATSLDDIIWPTRPE